jgi:L-amino acid N-acyltransferase YncA/AcrR family transcriptional regulator
VALRSPRIRPLAEGDWPQVHDLVVEVASAGETYAMDVPPDLAATKDFWAGEHDVVAVDGDTVLGAAKMGPNRPAQGAHVATASFMVSTAARGRGVGRALGEYAVAWLRDRGYRAIQFNAVVSSNAAAVALWRSLGFEVVGTLPRAFRLPDGSWADLLVMFLDLADDAPDEAPRGDDAEEARAAVVAAATRVFPRRGWSGTTVESLAAEAGLGVEEVAPRFGSKADLLILAMRHAGVPDHPDLPEAFGALRLEQVDDVGVRLQRIAEFLHDLIENLAPLVPVMWQAAGEDPTAAALRQGAELRRVALSRTIVELVRRDEDAGPDAVGAVQTLTSAENYLCLQGLGWTRERYVAWLVRSLDQAVNG